MPNYVPSIPSVLSRVVTMHQHPCCEHPKHATTHTRTSRSLYCHLTYGIWKSRENKAPPTHMQWWTKFTCDLDDRPDLYQVHRLRDACTTTTRYPEMSKQLSFICFGIFCDDHMFLQPLNTTKEPVSVLSFGQPSRSIAAQSGHTDASSPFTRSLSSCLGVVRPWNPLQGDRKIIYTMQSIYFMLLW